MNTPVSAYGAQSLLQHSPQPVHRVPSTPPEQLVAPVGGTAHVPFSCPGAIVQMPEQHVDPVSHTSPTCAQNDE